MTVNKYKPHLFVIPEDDADRQLANGFVLHHEVSGEVQIVKEAGGWIKVIETITEEYVPLLKQNPNAHVLGIIDCDNDGERIKKLLDDFPSDVQDRIFLLGVFDDPQQFKISVQKPFETIGETLAEECFTEELHLWHHTHLQHISTEIERAKRCLKPIVFV